MCIRDSTYCEDELPTRMDLGKEKYGGPFTTEQVEDVKAFLGILCLLLTLGPLFATEIMNGSLFLFFSHLKGASIGTRSPCIAKGYFSQVFMFGELSEVVILILIPFYICLLRPFIHRYIPGMLKRMGLGMILLLLSLLCTLLIDTIGHLHSSNKSCFLNHHGTTQNLNITIWYLSFPHILNGLGYLTFYIAAYEFICAQSPHAMKGLIIGTFYAIKGVFQLIGTTAIFVPFTVWNLQTSFPSCGFVYYLINVLVALIGLVAYTWVARRYQYRQRDEPDNIYRYAEEYYGRARDERFQNSYDYSNDYDNLNVSTVN